MQLDKEDLFDKCTPDDLRAASSAICRIFNINGLADPMYIVNVAAIELERGDGLGRFHGPGEGRDRREVEAFDMLANDEHGDQYQESDSAGARRLFWRLRDSYYSCIKKSEQDPLILLDIVRLLDVQHAVA